MKTTQSTLAMLRKALGITQSDLAQRLGVTRVTVGNWEKTEAPRVAMLAMETIQRTISSPAKARAEESGKI